MSRALEHGLLVVSIASLTAASAALCGAFNATLDLASHLAPLWLVGGMSTAILAISTTSSRRHMSIISGSMAAVCAVFLIIPEFTRPMHVPVRPGSSYVIKLVEYNAWVNNRNQASDAIWLENQHPDFILITDAMPPLITALQRYGFRYRKGIADTAIFSREAVAHDPYVIPGFEWPLLPSFARATFASPKGPFTLIATHLPRPTFKSEDALEDALLRVANHYDRRRLIVAGDFNLTPWSFALRRFDSEIELERRDRAIFSWPAQIAPAPFLPIDHIYAGPAWRTVSLKRGPKLGSDHYPMVVVLALTS